MQPGETLMLVDGSSLAYSSFFALLKSGMRHSGKPTWAVFGFLNSLFDVIERQKVEGLAVCFDLDSPTFRHEEFDEYKAHRQEMPDDLSQQWPVIKESVKILGIPLYELKGFEADDVIGTVARAAVNRGIKVQIFTRDEDAFQLIDDENESVRVVTPVPRKPDLVTYGRKEVWGKLGVWPEQIIDYKGLCGDTSDNIPGVKGIGPVTAVQLLKSFGTMENIYGRLDEIKSTSIRQKLSDGREMAQTSKRLATIRLDVPLEFDFEHCQLSVPCIRDLEEFLKNLGFKTMLARLPKLLSRFHGQDALLPNDSQSTNSVDGAAGNAVDGATDLLPPSVGTASVGARTAVALPPAPLLITNQDQLQDLIAALSQQKTIAIELETQGEHPLSSDIVGYAIAYSPSFDWESNTSSLAGLQTAYIPVQHGGLSEMPQEAIVDGLRPLLQDPRVSKVAHNVKAKINALSLLGLDLKPVVFDSMLASYILNSDDNHGLKEQADRLLGYTTIRTSQSSGLTKKQLMLNFASIDKVASCAADDARIVLELANYYRGNMDDEQQYLLYTMDLPLTSVLAAWSRQASLSICRISGNFPAS